MLHTIDIRRAFLNAEFTAADTPIYVKINQDVVPCWYLQDPLEEPYISQQGQLVLLLDFWSKQSPVKFQLHHTKTLTAAGYVQSINEACLFYKL